MTLVEHLPERDLGVAGDVDVLRTVADELKKTATHCIVMFHGKKKTYRVSTREKGMKVYAVSCSPDRMERLRAKASPLNLEIITVDSPYLTDPEVLQRGKNHLEKELGYPGGIAATIGHIRAMKMFLETNEETCLIVEDDVRFHKNFNQYISDVDDIMKSTSIDVFIVGYCSLCAPCYECHGRWSTYNQEIMFSFKTCEYCLSKTLQHNSILYYSDETEGIGVSNPYGAQGYVVRREFAKKFVDLFSVEDLYSAYPKYFVTDITIFDKHPPVSCRLHVLRTPIVVEDRNEQTIASNTNKPNLDGLVSFSDFCM
jgi:GR25 family glycosyltransferase involved in LPS biosynthesis